MLHPGLYKQVISHTLKGELSDIPEARKAVAPIDQAETSKVLAQYLADVVQKALDNMLDNGGTLALQVALTNQIVSLIQSTTQESDFSAMSVDQRAEQSPTGQRCIHHRKRGSRVPLFVREFKTDSLSGGAAAYTFLGTANYLRHEGRRPMNITWKLECPIPAKFLKRPISWLWGDSHVCKH